MTKRMETAPCIRALIVFLFACDAVSAVPQLRLSNTVVSVSAAVGGPVTPQTVDAFNVGDGSLSLSVSVQPSATWVTASLGASRTCPMYVVFPTCIPIQFTLSTVSLAPGRYTAEVTVSDPQAVDAPQVVIVTAQIGPTAPIVVDRWVAPGDTREVYFASNPCPSRSPCPTATATDDGGQWLSVAVREMGSSGAHFASYAVHLAPPVSMTPGTYHGTVTVSGAPNVSVTMRLATQRIAVASASQSQIHLRLAEGGPAATYPFVPAISLRDVETGALPVQSVTGAGSGVSAYKYADLAIVTIDPGSLAPGFYNDGMVTIQCNGANCPIQVPVSFEIVRQGPPLIQYRGVVNNSTFQSQVGAGDVVIAKGEQLSFSAPAFADGVGLPTSLGGARVLVNGVPAGLFYSSFGQIAFRMPNIPGVGTHLVQVERDGQLGNTVAVVESAPKILKITDASYNPRDVDHPAKAGETLIIWATGLGPTSPLASNGVAAPTNSPAVTILTPVVYFTFVPLRVVTPSFAGLSPGSVGLYQVNVTLPADTPPGTTPMLLRLGDLYSNAEYVAVQ